MFGSDMYIYTSSVILIIREVIDRFCEIDIIMI